MRDAILSSFNPTLVRLRPRYEQTDVENLLDVSIPRWFD